MQRWSQHTGAGVAADWLSGTVVAGAQLCERQSPQVSKITVSRKDVPALANRSMDETAYARPGSLSSLSSKSGTMSGPDKRHGSPRMSLYPSTAFPAGKKRLSMAEGTGPPPSSVAPYLAGAHAALILQRERTKSLPGQWQLC